MKKILAEIYGPRPDSRKELRHLVQDLTNSLCSLAWSDDPDQIESLLSSVEFERMDEIFISTILRCTFSTKEKYPSWVPARDRAGKVLEDRGLDYQHILRGLWE